MSRIGGCEFFRRLNRLRKKALLDRQRSDFLCAKRKERPMRGKDRQRGHLGGYEPGGADTAGPSPAADPPVGGCRPDAAVAAVRRALLADRAAFDPARAPAAGLAAAGVLHDPLGAATDGTVELQPAVPLVRRPVG